jgi:hypothetical protein
VDYDKQINKGQPSVICQSKGSSKNIAKTLEKLHDLFQAK